MILADRRPLVERLKDLRWGGRDYPAYEGLLGSIGIAHASLSQTSPIASLLGSLGVSWDFNYWSTQNSGNGYTGLGFGINVTTTSGAPFTVTGNAVVAVAPTATELSATRFTCSTAAGVQNASLLSNINSTSLNSIGTLRRIRFRLRPNQLTNTRLFIGLGGPPQADVTYQSDTPNTPFVGFRFSSNAGDQIYQLVSQSSTAVSSGFIGETGSHASTNAQIFEIQFDGSSTWTYLIGTTQTTLTPVGTIIGLFGNALATGLQPIIHMDNVVTGNASTWDFMYLRGQINDLL